jgi:hypothetical protein
MSEWHRAARETTPGELRWEKRDEIEAVCECSARMRVESDRDLRRQ